MWIKLSSTDIFKKKRDYFIKSVLLWFVLYLLIFTLITLFGVSKSGKSQPVSINQLHYHLPSIIILSLVTSLIASIYKLIRPEVLICNKCFKVKNNDGDKTCECGGYFHDFNNMKWQK